MFVVITAHESDSPAAIADDRTVTYRAIAEAAPFRRIEVTPADSAGYAAALVRAVRASGGGRLCGAYRVVDRGAGVAGVATEGAGEITFVNCLRFPPGNEGTAYAAWKGVNDHMITRPGYVSHTLHRRLDGAPFAS